MGCEKDFPIEEEMTVKEKELSHRLDIAVSYAGWLRGMVSGHKHKAIVAELLAFDYWYISEGVKRD